MKVVIAEKPSVARDLAKHLGATSRGNGFLEGNGWVVTWAFGHLIELQEPEDYTLDWKPWRLSALPIIPDPFQLRPRADGSATEQLATIKKFFETADEIICATDAGREGELIFRYILNWTGCEAKPVKRLWISSLTDEAIAKGFAELKPAAAYEPLYHAARCRSEADWIVGMNATRFFTVEYGRRKLLLSLGRVQTPILAMIVNRDLEVEYFVPEEFFEVHTKCRDAKFKHTGGKFTAQTEAQAIIEKVATEPLVVTGVAKKNALAHPPLLYDLTSLQRDMNKRHGFTADQTLKLAQSLYESKHLTYPRTDSCYLTADLQPTIAPLMEKLRTVKPAEIEPLDLAALNFSKRIIDDTKVADHHAIIPTTILGDRLSGDEAKLYDAVVTRLIAAFYPSAVRAVTTVDAVSAAEPFRARGTVIVDLGWEALYANDPKTEDDDEPPKRKGKGKSDTTDDDDTKQVLPDFVEGESNPHEPLLVTGKTSAPKRFNEASLLSLMETAGKIVTDETLKEALKEKGVGTPATRASIIEVLITRKYVERKRKALISTDSGRALIGLVQDERLKSPELTGDWEFRLKQMERGAYEPAKFMAEVCDYTREILANKAESTIDLTNLGPCPCCHAPVIRGRTGYGCSKWKTGCKFVLPGELWGLTVTPVLAREILIHKKSLTPHRIVVNGKAKFAHLRFTKKGEPAYDLAPVEKSDAKTDAFGLCPECAGDIVEGKKAYGCSNWKNGCGFVVWKTIAQKEITPDIVKALLANRETELLSGFTSKAGKPFDAKLKIIAGEVKFDFSG
ncbi:type IA DNA topoisomerase [Synoicihabitans lomoniglobus]|uniref:DNA topoisomerase n=1 Tax=Synoicihabitans lomoniglobus TaxID=2909285 RepID=A0AAE9ZXE1_9BACT|nr:DNA topoisomerase 3 [Opitutaceae bacterium LMO-M01]WED64298.1 DNA topoisomerase 3 [Opitutaceae bacterium LMO-M01]